jgi:hypothetical protein
MYAHAWFSTQGRIHTGRLEIIFVDVLTMLSAQVAWTVMVHSSFFFYIPIKSCIHHSSSVIKFTYTINFLHGSTISFIYSLLLNIVSLGTSHVLSLLVLSLQFCILEIMLAALPIICSPESYSVYIMKELHFNLSTFSETAYKLIAHSCMHFLRQCITIFSILIFIVCTTF